MPASIERPTADCATATVADLQAGSLRSCRSTSLRRFVPPRGTSAWHNVRLCQAFAAPSVGHELPDGSWQHPFVDGAGPPVPRDSRITPVAAEQLVAAFSGEHDSDVLACELRHEIQR